MITKKGLLPGSSKVKRRKLTAKEDDDRERRHRERMEQKERMFDWFKDYLTKTETKNDK